MNVERLNCAKKRTFALAFCPDRETVHQAFLSRNQSSPCQDGFINFHNLIFISKSKDNILLCSNFERKICKRGICIRNFWGFGSVQKMWKIVSRLQSGFPLYVKWKIWEKIVLWNSIVLHAWTVKAKYYDINFHI